MKVIGIGTAAVDYFFKVDKKFLKKFDLKEEDDVSFEEKKTNEKEILEITKPFFKSTGGMSTNTIAVLSQLGINTFHFSNIGENADSTFLKESLKKVNFKKALKKGDLHKCFCFLSSNGNKRTFLYKSNENENELFANKDFGFLKSFDHIHITPIYTTNPKDSLIGLRKIIKEIKNKSISFTPGIFYSRLGLKEISPILKKTKILFLNKKEIKILTGEDEKIGSSILLDFGPKIIVCTLGAKGVLITTKETQFVESSGKIKKIVDSTGAGDAFAAGFIFGLLSNRSLEDSAKIGIQIAGLSLTDYGLNWIKKLNAKKFT
jgi:ribokinase